MLNSMWKSNRTKIEKKKKTLKKNQVEGHRRSEPRFTVRPRNQNSETLVFTADSVINGTGREKGPGGAQVMRFGKDGLFDKKC